MAAAWALRCPCALTAGPGRAAIPHKKNGLSRARPLPRTIIGEKKKRTLAQRKQLRCVLQVETVPGTVSTEINEAEEYEVSYRGDGDEGCAAVGDGKGWTDAEGNVDERWVAKFRGLAVIAADRVAMHTVLADQRSNWNHLFHQTIVIASVSAATAAAINGAEPGAGLTLLATSLNLICAAFMALVNFQQPSQLAEEQRRAARFFRRLGKDIKSTLEVDPAMREDASEYWHDKVGTLHTLDGTFPLPLSPGGLEKFPRSVVPAELSPPWSPYVPITPGSEIGRTYLTNGLGWTPKTEDYLRKTMERIQTRDVPNLLKWAERVKRLNLTVAKISPFLALAGAVCTIANGFPALPLSHVSWLAAAFTVGAVLAHSVSHALQLGSAFESYRNYAGYYAEIERAIGRTLNLPVSSREDCDLFTKRINLRLGHDPDKESVQNNHPAGMLF